MREANSDPTTPTLRLAPPRRLLLALAGMAPTAAFPVATVVSGASAHDHPDRELLALCAEFDRLEVAYGATDGSAPAGSDREVAAEAEQVRIGDAQAKLAGRMHELRAVTLEGQAARARSLVGWAPDLLEKDEHTETMLVAAILRDLSGLPVDDLSRIGGGV